MGTEHDVLPDLSQALASLGRGSLVAKIERLEAEVAAYKKAKQENDERFLTERDQARAENKRLRQELAQALAPVPDTQETR